MNIQLAQRIKENQKSFSKGQRAIAKYITDSYDKAAFMTAAKLGTTVGVSESTVVRFATEIGYSGYPQLQEAMQEMIRNKLTTVQRLEITSANIPIKDVLDASLNQDIDIIEETKDFVSREEFHNAVDALSSAKTVYVLGAGSSLALATFLAHYLDLVFPAVHLIEATSEARLLQKLVKVNPDDAVIGISFPRYSRKAAMALKFAVSRGAKTIAITDSMLSPIAESAQHCLLARSDMVSFVDSLVGALSLINALIVTVAIKKKDEVKENLQKIESIWDEYGIYEKADDKNS